VLVESVSVRGFRNLGEADVALGPGINLVWGSNGAGKTNVLEALYMGLAGRSCRTRDDREAITFGESLARAEVLVAPGSAVAGKRRRAFLCSVSRSEGRRHLVDGAPAGPEAATLRPALAVFMPDRLALIKGAPAGRRTHLDGFCAALWPGRAEHRRRYSRALAQRNALLGRIRSAGAGEASLDAWDAELAAAGIELIATREAAIERLAAPFADAAGALGVEGKVAASYRPRSRAQGSDELAAELSERRAGDLARGYSGWGPHLDELALELDGRAIRRYASQGQQRLALLSLLFAERRVLLDDGRTAPLMLLDDVTSELDLDRRRLLVEHLAAGGGQALITATEADQLPNDHPRTEIAVRAGRILAPAGGARGAGTANPGPPAAEGAEAAA
jgi:DNA replication and repair protein RecF